MESLFNLIQEYGWSTILIFFLIGIIFIGVKYSIKKIENDVENVSDKIALKLSENSSEQNKILIGAINKQHEKYVNIMNEQNSKMFNIIIAAKEKELDIHTNKLHDRIILTEDINAKLREIGYKYKADRVSILEFHNTSQNLVGVPFAKYSCNFEWINKGSISLQAKCQSLPFSMISCIVKDIFESGGCYKQYKDINVFNDKSSGLFTVLKEVHCKSLIYNAIYDDKNNIIGLLALEYHNQFDENIDMDDLRIDAENITVLLNLSNKEKEYICD